MFSLKHDYENAELVRFDTGDDSMVTLTFDLALSSVPSDERVVVQLIGVQASDRLTPYAGKEPIHGSPEHEEYREPVQAAEESGRTVETLGTTPHQCHQCRQPLADPKTGKAITIGKRRALLNCPQCKRATSVYAMLHRCVSCSVLLESPLSKTTRQFTCPQCRAVAEIPGNLLYPVGDTTLNPHECYVVTCPSCDKQWAGYRADVRRISVCPGCHSSFPLPMIGEYLPPIPPEYVEKLIQCMGCHQKLPVNCGQCPVCGTTTNA